MFGEYSDIAAVNLLASVTKGFELMNDLLENFKLYSGKDFGGGMNDMMDFSRQGFDEEMLSMNQPKGGMMRFM